MMIYAISIILPLFSNIILELLSTDKDIANIAGVVMDTPTVESFI